MGDPEHPSGGKTQRSGGSVQRSECSVQRSGRSAHRQREYRVRENGSVQRSGTGYEMRRNEAASRRGCLRAHVDAFRSRSRSRSRTSRVLKLRRKFDEHGDDAVEELLARTMDIFCDELATKAYVEHGGGLGR